MSNSIPIFWLYILIFCIRVFCSFSFFALSCFTSHLCCLVFAVFMSVFMLPIILLAALNSVTLLFLMQSLSPCIDASTHFQCWWDLFFHLLLAHTVCLCHLLTVKPCTSSSTFLSFGPFVWVPLLYFFKEWSWVPYKRDCSDVFILWWDFCYRIRFRKAFSFN